jgi:broad specificity phosphatase PhoE
MELYLVRHGQTSGNIALRLQADNSSLTEHGSMQAHATAQKLVALKPTHLVSSTMLRAVETAQIIGEACNLVPETNALFVEVGRPNHMIGQRLINLSAFWFYTQWYFGLTKNDDAGSESYEQVRQRVKVAREHLETFPPDARVVVVSHSVFILFFVAHMCDVRPLGPFRALHLLYRVYRLKNASITPIHLDHAAPEGTCRFQLQKLT